MYRTHRMKFARWTVLIDRHKLSKGRRIKKHENN